MIGVNSLRCGYTRDKYKNDFCSLRLQAAAPPLTSLDPIWFPLWFLFPSWSFLGRHYIFALSLLPSPPLLFQVLPFKLNTETQRHTSLWRSAFINGNTFALIKPTTSILDFKPVTKVRGPGEKQLEMCGYGPGQCQGWTHKLIFTASPFQSSSTNFRRFIREPPWRTATRLPTLQRFNVQPQAVQIVQCGHSCWQRNSSFPNGPVAVIRIAS